MTPAADCVREERQPEPQRISTFRLCVIIAAGLSLLAIGFLTGWNAALDAWSVS